MLTCRYKIIGRHGHGRLRKHRSQVGIGSPATLSYNYKQVDILISKNQALQI